MKTRGARDGATVGELAPRRRRSSTTTSRATTPVDDADAARVERRSRSLAVTGVGVREEDDVVRPLPQQVRVVDRAGAGPSTPSG